MRYETGKMLVLVWRTPSSLKIEVGVHPQMFDARFWASFVCVPFKIKAKIRSHAITEGEKKCRILLINNLFMNDLLSNSGLLSENKFGYRANRQAIFRAKRHVHFANRQAIFITKIAPFPTSMAQKCQAKGNECNTQCWAPPLCSAGS